MKRIDRKTRFSPGLFYVGLYVLRVPVHYRGFEQKWSELFVVVFFAREATLCYHKSIEKRKKKMCMDFLTLAKSRCTTRGFLDRPLAKEDLDYILAAARVAPTACNRQPQRIIVVRKPENLLKVGKAYKTFGAPCALIVCRDRREELVRPFDQKCSGDLDIGIVCDHMMLAAREKGFGSVMVGLFDPAIITAEFSLPEYIEPTALLFMGLPAQGFLSPERHDTARKPLSGTVMFESYGE